MTTEHCKSNNKTTVYKQILGIDSIIIGLLNSTVGTYFGEKAPFYIGKVVRHGSILTPLLFNIYAEKIMRETLDTWEGGIGIRGRLLLEIR